MPRWRPWWAAREGDDDVGEDVVVRHVNVVVECDDDSVDVDYVVDVYAVDDVDDVDDVHVVW